MEDTLVALVLPVLVALDYVITLIMGCFHAEGVRTTPPGYEDPTVLAEETACMYVSPPHLVSLLSSLYPPTNLVPDAPLCKKPQFFAF
jgi:hypothetical protein